MTHLDLTHAVPVISQFMTAPRSVHLAAVFRIIRYVRGTLSRAFFFPSKRAFVNNRCQAFKGRANSETSLSGSSRSSFLALEVPGSIFLVRLDVISTSPCGVKWDVQGDADDGNGAREDIGERDGIAFYGEAASNTATGSEPLSKP
ncbi:hypothetical protein V6N13_011535 [Hibiscus sabdariffa]